MTPEFLAKDLLTQYELRLPADGANRLEAEISDLAATRKYLFRISKIARKSHCCFFFILDGLDCLALKETKTRQEILELLPIGLPFFKFVISGSKSSYPELKLDNLTARNFLLPQLALDETRLLLNSSDLEDSDFRYLHKACKGIPAKLVAVKRLLRDSPDPRSVARRLPDNLPTIFQLDWQSTDRLKEQDLQCIAVLAHEQNPHTISSLSELLDKPQVEIEDVVRKISFLEVDDRSQVISFLSEGHRQFAQIQLQAMKNDVIELAVRRLSKHPVSKEALSTLPTYLSALGRADDCFTYLSPEHIEKMLEVHLQCGPGAYCGRRLTLL